MDIELTPVEARVIGALVEKDFTTPDGYPLSLNAIVNACNQKSNRDPIMDLTESDVMTALDTLMSKYLVREKNVSGGRVSKYAHRLSDSLGLKFGFSRNGLGTLCTLLLRGPQTPGEIRARTGRLCEFASLADVEETLEALMTDERGPFVTRLERQPGRKESRFAHLLCGEVAEEAAPPPALARHPVHGEDERIAALERDVAALREEIEILKRRLGDPG